MNEIKITITDDKKEKENSFQATADFNYQWDDSWLCRCGEMSMIAYGSTEKEAKERLLKELFAYQSEFAKVLFFLQSNN